MLLNQFFESKIILMTEPIESAAKREAVSQPVMWEAWCVSAQTWWASMIGYH